MKTITLEIELTYDDDMMHGNTPDGLEWFRCIVLQDGLRNKSNLLRLYSDALDDMIGEVRVVSIRGDL